MHVASSLLHKKQVQTRGILSEQTLYKIGALSEPHPRTHLLREYGSVTGFM